MKPTDAPQVLVVDADDDTRALYRRAAELDGCHVVEAPDGRDALTRALIHPPVLVVTDVSLPLLDGYALCEILRRDRATASVPILVITAEARAAQLDQARRAGANAILVKPAAMDMLLSEMRRLIAESIVARPPAMRGPADHRSTALAKFFPRVMTTTPPAAPPALRCPSCDEPLKYECSHVGGVSPRHPEQWDYFTCRLCGAFQYRQRTRRTRRIDSVPAHGQTTAPATVHDSARRRFR